MGIRVSKIVNDDFLENSRKSMDEFKKSEEYKLMLKLMDKVAEKCNNLVDISTLDLSLEHTDLHKIIKRRMDKKIPKMTAYEIEETHSILEFCRYSDAWDGYNCKYCPGEHVNLLFFDIKETYDKIYHSMIHRIVSKHFGLEG